MRRIVSLIFAMLACVLVSQPVMAVEGPKAGYSADGYMETADGVQEGPVYYMPGMERREYAGDGGSMVMIIRHDKKLIWTMMPDDKMYMESKFPEGGRKDDLGSYKMERTAVGSEEVNGVKAAKTKVIMTGKKGEKMGGFMWTTGEGIVVKMDIISVDKKSKERIKNELKNLKVGRQDQSLFEIPADYSRMDMGMGMGGIGRMMGRDDEDDDAGNDGEDQPQDNGGKKASGLKGWGLKDLRDIKEAVDMFKK